MGDTFRKVRDGEKLRIPARTYNAMVDAAQDYINRKNNLTTESGKTLPANMVYVKNTTGAAVDRLNILGIGGSEIDATTNTFKEITVLTGVTPSIAYHSGGRFVIAIEPIAAGSIGRAYVAGYTPVQINVTDESHACADISDGDVTQLASAQSGSAVILYKESGTGTKLAVIRFGGGGSIGSSSGRATVIKAVTPPNPNASTGDSDYAGSGFYVLRDANSNYSTWEINHSPAYAKGTKVVDPDNKRLYIVTADPCVTNLELPPRESDEYEISEEIKIEYVSGHDLDGSEKNIKDFVPVYGVGENVAYKSRTLSDGTTRYYLDEPLIPVGEPEIRGFGMFDGVVRPVW